MACPTEVLRLVERFRLHSDDYHAGAYNEAQVRREFVDPLFKALGWDVDNEQGHAEAYKDVIHEDSIKVGGVTKAPDYCFRIGGTRKFFLEAKRPTVHIKDDGGAAYQLRRYAWSAKLPLSILTDFEELAVYDCRVKPHKDDKASTARLLYLRYEELPQRWDELAGIFSCDAILKGSFDRFAESNRRKRGTAEVDAAFLAEIEAWRSELARNMALRNPGLAQRELNFAVQRTIDRLVFLRIAEDRAIEEYGRLQRLLDGDHVYRRLGVLFREADERYNSGIFHFEAERGRHEPPDELTLALDVDDKILKDMIRGLYYPDSPYEFSVLPAEILGQVYEQFLGKVIHLTPGHRASVVDKPEVRKAGGVYYTPTYIVEYIVGQTVGRLLEGKTPKQASKLHILDPACGSGSFLLGAYQHLLNWHLQWYLDHDPRKHPHAVAPAASGAYRLTTQERKRILLNNIHGVDIDAQAVEVTKLSLLLKVLEGANRETLERQLRLFRERALPDLGRNIKCGNALIGKSFLAASAPSAIDDDAMWRVNPFDWSGREGFPGVMADGGFDAVIGNPPYVNAWELYATMPAVRDFINGGGHFQTADRHWDLYVLFLEQGLRLLKDNGRMAFIIPFSYAIQKYAAASRKLLLSSTTIESIADFRSVQVFHPVPVITIIPVIKNHAPSPKHQIQVVTPAEPAARRERVELTPAHTVQQSLLLKQHEQMWRLDLSPAVTRLIQKIDARSLPLGQLCYINYGAQMSSKAKGGFGKQHVIRDRRVNRHCRPMVSGRELYRYSIRWAERYADWSFADQMYGPRWPEFFELPKLMIRDITGGHRIEATLDDAGFYCDHTILCALRKADVVQWRESPAADRDLSAKYDLRYLAALTASKLVSAYYYYVLTGEGVRIGGGFHTYPHTIQRLPVFAIDFASPDRRVAHDELAGLVTTILDLEKRRGSAKTDHAQALLARQIDAADQQIDRRLYDLYGLTDKEIALVEAAVGETSA